jgi:hypothetical protein
MAVFIICFALFCSNANCMSAGEDPRWQVFGDHRGKLSYVVGLRGLSEGEFLSTYESGGISAEKITAIVENSNLEAWMRGLCAAVDGMIARR